MKWKAYGHIQASMGWGFLCTIALICMRLIRNLTIVQFGQISTIYMQTNISGKAFVVLIIIMRIVTIFNYYFYSTIIFFRILTISSTRYYSISKLFHYEGQYDKAEISAVYIICSPCMYCTGCNYVQHIGLGVIIATEPAWLLEDLDAMMWQVGKHYNTFYRPLLHWPRCVRVRDILCSCLSVI